MVELCYRCNGILVANPSDGEANRMGESSIVLLRSEKSREPYLVYNGDINLLQHDVAYSNNSKKKSKSLGYISYINGCCSRLCSLSPNG